MSIGFFVGSNIWGSSGIGQEIIRKWHFLMRARCNWGRKAKSATFWVRLTNNIIATVHPSFSRTAVISYTFVSLSSGSHISSRVSYWDLEKLIITSSILGTLSSQKKERGKESLESEVSRKEGKEKGGERKRGRETQRGRNRERERKWRRGRWCSSISSHPYVPPFLT